MVKYYDSDIDIIFEALSHPIRRNILKKLLDQEHTVGDLARPFNVSMPAITKHLHVLEKARLLRRERQGREYILSINTKPLLQIKKWIMFYEQIWIQELESLK